MKFTFSIKLTKLTGAVAFRLVAVNAKDEAEALEIARAVATVLDRGQGETTGGIATAITPSHPSEITLEAAILWALTGAK